MSRSADQLQQSLRALPAVDRLLQHELLEPVSLFLAREWMTLMAREVLEDSRAAIRQGGDAPELDVLAARVAEVCRELRHGGIRRVINATGIVLHTNLGRSPLSLDVARDAMAASAQSVSVEMDLRTGERGNRYESVQRLLSVLTGCESSLVVNNNAAAVLLVLNTFARDKEVILSRGEMIEIGGSFRLPEIILSSGAGLREVGTTNRTHLKDYRNAVSSRSGLLMKAHTSNYRVEGFTHSVPAQDLLDLSKETGVPVYEDLGSGSLIDIADYGLTSEPTVQQVVAFGIPIVSFSGDKLLGGPQAGIIVGEKRFIDAILENHLLRALRIDKVSMALLERTLQTYLDPAGPQAKVPIHFLLSRSVDALEQTARELVARCESVQLQLEPRAGSSAVGGGACPTDELSTWVVELIHPRLKPDALARRFRSLPTPVLGRIRGDRFCLDMRALLPQDLEELITSLRGMDEEIDSR